MSEQQQGAVGQPIDDETVAAFVERYLTAQGMPVEGIGPRTKLVELGLDSITISGLLIAARSELMAAGRLAPGLNAAPLPPLVEVADLGAALRAGESRPGQ